MEGSVSDQTKECEVESKSMGNRGLSRNIVIFITHQVPKGLQVDEVVNMGQHAMHMSLVKEDV